MDLSKLPPEITNKIFYYVGGNELIDKTEIIWLREIVFSFRHNYCSKCGDYNRYFSNYSESLCTKCYFYNLSRLEQLNYLYTKTYY